MKTNVILYVRVSTDEQAAQGSSLETQEMRLRQYCSVEGYNILRVFTEDYSAKNFERPTWKKVREFIKANRGQVNKILILRWDRFSRNVHEALSEIKHLKKYNVEVEPYEQKLDMSVPESKAILTMYLTMPEIENDKISIRTKDGLHQAKLNGCWVSTAPFGYSLVRLGKDSTLAPNKDAILVQELFDLMATGAYSIEELRKILRPKGYTKSKNNTYNILRNVAYLGKIFIQQYKNEPEMVIKAKHEAIIDQEVFDVVQDILRGKRRKHKRSDKTAMYPLKRLLRCPICGRAITGSASTSQTKVKYHYYHCTHSGHQRVGIDTIHAAFASLLNSFIVPEEIMALHEEILLNELNNQNKGYEQQLQEIDQQIDKVKSKIARIEDRYAEGEIGTADFKSMKTRFDNEENDLIMRRTTLKMEIAPLKQEIRYAAKLVGNLGTILKNVEEDNARIAILSSMFPSPLYFENNGFRTQEVNSLVELFVLNNRELQGLKIEKSRLSSGLSSMAPPSGLEPETL